MNKPFGRMSAAALSVVLILAAFLSPFAWSQVIAAANYVTVGVSSSGNLSTAWLYEPSSRQVVACQTVVAPNTGLSNIQCVASKLP